MAVDSPDPAIVRAFARRNTVEDLDVAIGQVAEAVLTGAFSNLSVLGMNTSISADRADITLKTLEAARQLKLEDEDTSGETTAIALDALSPLSHGLDFSRRRIE